MYEEEKKSEYIFLINFFIFSHEIKAIYQFGLGPAWGGTGPLLTTTVDQKNCVFDKTTDIGNNFFCKPKNGLSVALYSWL